MNKILILLIALFCISKSYTQIPVCPNFNLPVPLADSCAYAPFLCGNFLEGYCSSTDSLSDDSISGWTFTAGGFLRLAPCADSLVLGVTVQNCIDTFGLRVRLFGGDCDSLDLMTEYVVTPDSAVELLFGSLVPDAVYYLAFDSPDGDVCSFSLSVLAGMGTATPGDTCSCTDGTIDGPSVLCPGQIASYTIIPPSCTLIPGDPVGGNGVYCPPPPEVACSGGDSLTLVWHIPDAMMFIGDSTGTTIQVQVDTALQSVDTVIHGLIWVEWKIGASSPDTLSFCACNGCSGAVLPKEVVIKHVIRYEHCTLTCQSPTCIIDGILYTAPGQYVQFSDTCVVTYVTIDQDITPPFVDAGPDQTICFGQTAQLIVQPFLPEYLFLWNTGESGPAITVHPLTTTTYTVTVINIINGCIAEDKVTVVVTPVDTVSLGVVDTISCLEPCAEVFGNTYCLPGIYALDSACTKTFFEIFFYKPEENLGTADTITCTEPCVTVLGQTYCEPGDYTVEDSCKIYHFSILIDTVQPLLSPVLYNCLPSNLEYTVSFSIQGTGPFKVNGDTLSGPNFLSAPVPNGSTYNFVVEQAGNGCLVIETGMYSCANLCTGSAGEMSATPIEGCAGQTIQATAEEPAMPGPGEITEFILHTLSGDSIGTILGRNTSGTFVFDTTLMTPGQTYYISQVTGPATPDDKVDLSHPCTDVAPGQPVYFYELTLTLGPDQTIHQGGSVTLEATTNAGKLAGISWTANDQPQPVDALQWQATPAGITDYFCAVTDSNGCMASDLIRVQVNEGALFYPNVLYPGSTVEDNRYFTVFSTEGYIRRVQSLEVFNRWGELLFSRKNFEANQPAEGWDGQAKGKSVPQSVYTFVARVELFDGKEEVLSGDVTLLR